MRIVAYNFLSGGSVHRNGHWSRVVRTFAPDLILAQECRPPQSSHGERFRHNECDAFAWQPAGSRRWGTGLLARSVALTPVAVPDFDGWVVGGRIRNPSWSKRAISVFSIHAPVGDRGYIRTMHQILDRIAKLRDDADLV